MASTTGDGARALGAFVLGRRIAVGGMAEVFEARRADGRGPPLVVKVLLPQYARDPEIVETLRHEAEIAAALAHDAIVRVVAFGTDGGETWLAMERVDGGTLADLVAYARGRGERVPLAAALFVGLELLGALGHVHDATSEAGAPLGIVHRDVTPENLLVSRAGDVKLGDFGIARSAKRGGRTRTGVIKGKLAYLAPEQATGSTVDARTDLYAAGVVIWELVTGNRWLDAATEVELLRLAEDPGFRAPSELAGAPPALDAVLERALRRFPEERYASATAMRDALARVAASVATDRDGRAELAALALSAFGPSDDAAGEAADRGEARAGGAREPRGQPVTRPRRLVGAIGAFVVLAAAAIGIRAATHSPESEVTSTPTVADAQSAAVVAADGAAREGGAMVVQASVDAGITVSAGGPAGAALDAGPRGLTHADRRPPHTLRASHARRAADADRRAVSTRTAGTSPADAGRTPSDPRAGAVRARRDALAASLRTRHIAQAELPAPLPARLAELDHAIDASRLDDAVRLLDELEPAVEAVRVDAAFVRRKLDRVGARIAAARRRGADTRELEDLAAAALQVFLDGRFEETNRRLAEIEARLP